MKPLLAFLMFAAVIAFLAVLAVKHSSPQPNLPLVAAGARMWVNTSPAPPQFCPSPMPLCTDEDCPKRRSIA